MFGGYVAAVICRPTLNHCVVMCFWSSWTMDCICLHLKIDFRACASVVSGAESFITIDKQLKPEDAFFLMLDCFLWTLVLLYDMKYLYLSKTTLQKLKKVPLHS